MADGGEDGVGDVASRPSCSNALRLGESEAEAVMESSIRSRVQAILSDVGHTKTWELEWWSIYTE